MDDANIFPRTFISHIADCCEQLLCRYARRSKTKIVEFNVINPIHVVAAMAHGCPSVIYAMHKNASAFLANDKAADAHIKFTEFLPSVLTILIVEGLKLYDLDGLITE